MVVPDREPLTEAEARKIGESAQQIARLRDILHAAPLSATITIKTNSGGQPVVNLGYHATVAAVALLIEREAQFLSSMGVTVEKA